MLLQKNKGLRLTLVLVVSLFFTTCKKDHLLDCIKSAGDEVTQIRPASLYENIIAYDNVDVVYHEDSVFKIKVTAGIHLIDGIITELQGNTLYIRNENRCNWVRSFKNKYTVEISAPSVSKATFYGSGNFTTVDTLRGAEVTCESRNGSGTFNLKMNVEKANLFNHTGRADFKVSGRAGLGYIYMNDNGVIDASNFIIGFCYLRSSTTGKCIVRPLYELGAEIRSVGDVYYYGPVVKVVPDITGTGRLIAL